MKIWKKNLVAVAVLVTVCGGIYANWVYSGEQAAADLTDTLNEDKILSSDSLVMADGSSLDSDNEVNTMTDYFAAVRLSRQEARDSAVTLLQEAMAYSDEADITASNAQLEQIVEVALCEAQIESLVIAKGYADCVAYISDDAISIAVAAPEGGLQQADVAVITDIVLTQSQYTMDQIYVVEVL
ncbi:MAG: SpoIIIAH-like family protein [Oscillospiraceae bacterium]|nr:SpoIIIAH-like family protein [Oscillospiraceae bacterium]MBQ4642539.1 SpoIIIAH-like family protein [Oscillospiraceae bacterium]